MIDRFFAKVVKHPGGCWIFTAGEGVYGRFSVNGRSLGAHRVSWYLHTGAWPTLNVCHACDTPRCVYPAHLFVGSHDDNMRDMAEKGRAVAPRGEASHLTRLSEVDVMAIYQSAEAQRVIAARYGVSRTAVSAIKTGRTWGWLTQAA